MSGEGKTHAVGVSWVNSCGGAILTDGEHRHLGLLAALHPYVRFDAIDMYSTYEEVDQVPVKAIGGFWLGSYVLDAG